MLVGIERRDDELATLYDILFDEEILCGMRMFSETRRCYRLTKQAFINISYGLTLQTGLTAQGAAPVAYKWKKNDNSTNNNDWRSNNRLDNYNSQKGFTQNHQQNHSNNNDNQNTVSQFFSAYRKPNAKNIAKISQVAKQELEVNMTQPLLAPSQPTKTVDAEFQAMWSQLQQKLPSTPLAPTTSSPPSSVISPQAVSEQTNALKKFLKINGGDPLNELQSANQSNIPPALMPCTHNGACCAELDNFCKRLGLSYEYSQRIDRQSGDMYGVISFPDGIEYVGPKSKDRPQASESVACIALRQYPGILAKRTAKSKMGMKGGPPGMPMPATRGVPFPFTNRGRPAGMVMGGPQLVQNFMTQVPPRVPGPPPLIPAQTLLPNPPQQWCQQPSAASPKSNPFVPLQAQTAAIAKSQDSRGNPNQQPQPPTSLTGQRLNSDVVRPIPQSPKKKTSEQPSSSVPQTSQPKKGRKGRIAAKFSTPLQN